MDNMKLDQMDNIW